MKSKGKGIFAEAMVFHCVILGFNFEDNMVVKVGYLGNEEKYKVLNEQ
jgi:hypothetical protein